MATIPATKTTEIAQEERLSLSLNNQTCDKCGTAVSAKYRASKNGLDLFFCGHHIRLYDQNLRDQGFAITPDKIDF